MSSTQVIHTVIREGVGNFIGKETAFCRTYICRIYICLLGKSRSLVNMTQAVGREIVLFLLK